MTEKCCRFSRKQTYYRPVTFRIT